MWVPFNVQVRHRPPTLQSDYLGTLTSSLYFTFSLPNTNAMAYIFLLFKKVVVVFFFFLKNYFGISLLIELDRMGPESDKTWKNLRIALWRERLTDTHLAGMERANGQRWMGGYENTDLGLPPFTLFLIRWEVQTQKRTSPWFRKRSLTVQGMSSVGGQLFI